MICLPSWVTIRLVLDDVLRKKPRLWRDAITAFALIFFLWLIAMKLQQHNEQVLAGPFAVVDGDTLSLAGERLRLRGLDAPELKQSCGAAEKTWACGQAARTRLAELVVADTTCRGAERDKYRRLLVFCRAGEDDPAAQMVREGLAVSFGAYVLEEAQARLAHRGLWAGDFMRPIDWRREHAAMEGDGDMFGWIRRLFTREDAP